MKKMMFQEINNRNQSGTYSVNLDKAQSQGIRVKGDKEYTGEEEDYLVWEQGSHEVVAIRYGNNHPENILKRIKEDLSIGFADEVPSLIKKLPKKSQERKIAERELSEWIEMQGEQPVLKVK